MAPRPRPHDKFLVGYKIGNDLQLSEVRPEQRWIWVAGVLALAAQSPIRGHLLTIKAEPLTERHVAEAAGSEVTTTKARNALAAFRELDLILEDAELRCEYVPNFKLYNPDQPAKSTEGERQRKREQRARQKIAARLDDLPRAA